MTRQANPALRKAVEDFVKAVVAAVGENVQTFVVVEYGPEGDRVVACASTLTEPLALVDLVGKAVGESAARLAQFQRPAGPMQ